MVNEKSLRKIRNDFMIKALDYMRESEQKKG